MSVDKRKLQQREAAQRKVKKAFQVHEDSVQQSKKLLLDAKRIEMAMYEQFGDVFLAEKLDATNRTKLRSTDTAYVLVCDNALHDATCVWSDDGERLDRDNDDRQDKAYAGEPFLLCGRYAVAIAAGTLEIVCFADGDGLPVRGRDLDIGTTEWSIERLTFRDESGRVLLDETDPDRIEETKVWDDRFLDTLDDLLEYEKNTTLESTGDWDSPAYELTVRLDKDSGMFLVRWATPAEKAACCKGEPPLKRPRSLSPSKTENDKEKQSPIL